jgi:glycosyltransferase involved in cell wall biosynthesis
MSASPGRRVLFLVENLSVPLDRRVWQEATALKEWGHDVAVICPRGVKHDPEPHAVIDGIEIDRYPLRPAEGGPLGYAREYGSALYGIAKRVRRLSRRRPFDVVHTANPPDILLLGALETKRHGARFVYDQNDLNPELYLSRFGGGKGFGYRATLAAERLAYRIARVVIAPNESYRRVALDRGRKAPEDVFVVRSAPDLSRFVAKPPDESLKRGRAHLFAYLGVMGPQDGVDHALRALAELRTRRADWRAIFIGEGDVWAAMQELAGELGLADDVEFPGRLPDEDVMRILSSADIGLAPDPKNPLNDVSTMNKIVEYMALSRPVVAYDLIEARASAGDAALYARANDVSAFAACIEQLLDDPGRRAEMGRIGRKRVEDDLSWDRSKEQLRLAYDRLFAA